MSTMHAAAFGSFGSPAEELHDVEVQILEPEAGQVRIKLILSPVHNHDLLLIRGEYGYRPELPMIAGSEGLGTIDKIGPGVTGMRVGERVAVSDVAGVWADYFVVEADKIIAIPDKVPDGLAAQLVGMPLSAITALDELDAKSEDWILVNAANGAVGRTIAQIAVGRGLNVANIVNRIGAKQDLEAQGIKNIFVLDDDNAWIDAVRNTIGKARVAGGIDMVSGPMAGQLASLISQGGKLLSFGAMSGQPMQLNPGDLIFKQISVYGFWNLLEQKQMPPARRKKLIDELMRLAVSGQLKLPVSKKFTLDHAADAAAASAAKRNGKVMISARAAA